MKRVMVALMVLLMAGVIVSSGAFSIPSSLSGLSIPSLGTSSLGTSSYGSSVPTSLGSFSTPSSSYRHERAIEQPAGIDAGTERVQ